MQINNLARDNLQDKLPLLAELVTDEYWPYFANYMVVKRAAQVDNSIKPFSCSHGTSIRRPGVVHLCT